MPDDSQKWVNVFADGFLRAFAYIVGVEQLKMFVSKAGEAIIAQSEEEDGFTVQGSTIFELVESTGKGITEFSPGNVEWNTEEVENGAKISIKDCPFSKLCSGMIGEIISGGRVEKKKVPCIMAELASGSCRNQNVKARASIESFSPGHLCVSEILKSEI